MKKFPEGTISLFAEEVNVSDRMIKKYIRELKNLGLIRRIGSNRNGHWEVQYDFMDIEKEDID